MKERSYLMWGWLLLLVIAWVSTFCPSAVAAQGKEENLPPVSFENEILPVLKQYCLHCHGAALSEGDLQFDAGREATVKGGHTGSAILGTSSADSEFFRRITSTKPGYRMPKEDDGLSAAEVELVKRWLDQGAPWPAVTKPKARKPKDLTITQQAGNYLADFTKRLEEPSFRNLFWLSVGFGVLALVGLWRALRRSGRVRAGFEMPRMEAAWKNWAIGALLFLLFATWIHYDGKADRAAEETAKAKKELYKYAGSPDDDPLEPPYPMHLKRLGGVYYRGNDERNAALFNGGFYQTAKLEVWLVDESGKRLGWGDTVSGPLFVEFEIHRAPNTSGELFSEQVMSCIVLADSVSSQLVRPAGKIAQMESVTPDQFWKARLPIGEPASWASGETDGKLFVVQQTSKPKPHYGIVFEVAVVDGKIADTSQLWMGSLYDLNGRVLVPHEGKVLLDRWLDWRPIPEVEGSNTDDPELLGLPEHLGNSE